jgi:hypothetical protein
MTTTHWKDVKKAADVCLDGITVSAEKNSDRIVRLELTDASGHVLHIEPSNVYETVRAKVVAPPKMVKRFRLAGDFLGVTLAEQFDNERAAKARKDELEAVSQAGDIALKIEPIEVPEEE